MSKHSVLASVATLKELLTDRGLDLGDLAGVGEEEVEALISSLDVFVLKSVDKDIIYILKKLKNSELVKAAELIAEDRRGSTIIVSNDKMSGVNMECAYTNFGRTVETFTLDELMINISHHEIVPKHELITPEEAKALLTGLKLKTPAQLPIIYKTDPMARYIGARSGDVVRIHRKSLTAGKTIFYRYCV